MKCYQCGQELQRDQKFCTSCGYNMSEGATTVLDQSNNPFAQQEENATTVLDQSNNPFTQQSAAPAFQPSAQEPVFGYTPPNAPPTQVPQSEFVFGQTPGSIPSAQRPQIKRPMVQLPTERGLLKYIFLGLITFGIYNTVVLCRIPTELNILASRYDGRRTMPFFAMVSTAPITAGILPFVWYTNLCDRIGNELNRRGYDYKFDAGSFWLWNILGSLIIVGPFVFIHKLMKAMNILNKDFNEKG